MYVDTHMWQHRHRETVKQCSKGYNGVDPKPFNQGAQPDTTKELRIILPDCMHVEISKPA